MTVRGFFDGRCTRCGARIGWAGGLTDQPPCHKCGHQPDPAKLSETQEAMDAAREELREGIRKRRLAKEERNRDDT